MKRQWQEIGPFLGTIQNVDSTHIPLGGMVTSQNMVQYFLGRLQRIPGVTALTPVTYDGQYQIPLLSLVREMGGAGTANQLLGVYIGNENLLTANQASVESGTTGFVGNLGTETLSQDCTTSAFGSCSLKVVTAATSNSGAITLTGVNGVPVTVGVTYSFGVTLKTSVGQSMNLNMSWYKADGTFISTSTASASVTTGFTRFSMVAAAPATAAFVAVGASINTATALTIWMDGLQLEVGNGAGSFVLPGAGNLAIPINLTTGLALFNAGASWSSALTLANYSYVFYNNQHLLFADGQIPYKITSVSATAALSPTGSPPASGGLALSFQDRLYWAGTQTLSAEEGIVHYSDPLTNNFQALNIVNTKEISGPITALGIYVPSTGSAGAPRSGLLIFKKNAIWVYNVSSKDVISQKIGTQSPKTVQNTPAGVVFLGQKGTLNSVFLIPPGLGGYGLWHFGEPIDIGKPLYNILNSVTTVQWFVDATHPATWSGGIVWSAPSGLQTPILAHGTVDGKFYKLYMSIGQGSTNNMEFWLDLDILTQNPGETREGREPQAVWWGPHTRGSFDASAAQDSVSSAIALAQRGLPKTNTSFQENVNIASNFLDVNGNTLIAFVDIPLNFQPDDVLKQFGRIELHIPPEAHIAGNQITYFPVHDGDVDIGDVATIMDTGGQMTHLELHMFDQDTSAGARRMGNVGHHPRIQIQHLLNQRFDIIGISFEYWIMEKNRIIPMIRTV